MRHVLPADVYYRLRYLQAAQERDDLRVLLAQQQAAESARRYTHALCEAGQAHMFDPAAPYRWDDAQTALVGDR